jgi:hypothetical protein
MGASCDKKNSFRKVSSKLGMRMLWVWSEVGPQLKINPQLNIQQRNQLLLQDWWPIIEVAKHQLIAVLFLVCSVGGKGGFK